jgi:hypothetical protein
MEPFGEAADAPVSLGKVVSVNAGSDTLNAMNSDA